MNELNLTPAQQERINNIELINQGVSICGLIAGVVYSKRTGGGFLRGFGWAFAGSTGGYLVSSLITTPMKNKILRENPQNPITPQTTPVTLENTFEGTTLGELLTYKHNRNGLTR